MFQEAATRAGAREVLDLRRRAAEQQLRSGHIDAGTEALAEVLASVGLRLPTTARAAILSLLVERAGLRLRGLALRRGSGHAPGALARVDACGSATAGLLMIARPEFGRRRGAPRGVWRAADPARLPDLDTRRGRARRPRHRPTGRGRRRGSDDAPTPPAEESTRRRPPPVAQWTEWGSYDFGYDYNWRGDRS